MTTAGDRALVVGDRVSWVSRSPRGRLRRTGEVVHVVRPGRLPLPQFRRQLADPGGKREGYSYVVRATDAIAVGNPKRGGPYWPREVAPLCEHPEDMRDDTNPNMCSDDATYFCGIDDLKTLWCCGRHASGWRLSRRVANRYDVVRRLEPTDWQGPG